MTTSEPNGVRSNPALRRALRVLAMVAELHKRGFQRARISPGMASSGMNWRCTVTSADNTLRSNGALIARFDDRWCAAYTTGKDDQYFGWKDAEGSTARHLADLFIERYPIIAERSLGEDWPYAGWYVQMLGLAEQGFFPVAYDDYPEDQSSGLLNTINLGDAGRSPDLPRPPGGLTDTS